MKTVHIKFWYVNTTHNQMQQEVCHTVALPLTLKGILRQKKDYGNSNISPCKSIIFKKSSKRNQFFSRYHNSITNLKFQNKPKYHLSKNPHIKIQIYWPKSIKLLYSIINESKHNILALEDNANKLLMAYTCGIRRMTF